MGSAEQNRAWVRHRVKAFGMEEEIASLAYVHYIALYMNDQSISEMFREIVGGV